MLLSAVYSFSFFFFPSKYRQSFLGGLFIMILAKFSGVSGMGLGSLSYSDIDTTSVAMLEVRRRGDRMVMYEDQQFSVSRFDSDPGLL